MDDFKNFINISKESIIKLHNIENIHFVIGNESVDLDSTISPLLLAYLIYKNIALLNIPKNSTVVPIINTSYQNFLIRTENCYVLNEIGIDLTKLVYRDEINVKNIKDNNINVTTSLVDHHILGKDEKILEESVIQIIDHRPVDVSSNWNKDKVNIKILPVGSCATLISDEILKTNESVLTKELAFLLYQTIVFDTVALLPENGRVKKLDIIIAEKLEKTFKFNISRKDLFDKLWTVHNDITKLTPIQILYKDLKIVEDILVPGLPLLVRDFLKLKNSRECIKQLISNEGKSDTVVLIGLDATSEVQRDVAIFSQSCDNSLKDILKHNFINSKIIKGYDLSLEEIDLGYDNIVLFKQNNISLSRKHIIPLIKDSVIEYLKI